MGFGISGLMHYKLPVRKYDTVLVSSTQIIYSCTLVGNETQSLGSVQLLSG